MQFTADALIRQLDLADVLLAGRGCMFEPQDLPGRYGRVVRALDQVLKACNCEAVVAGGWAVWRHGYVGRITQDIDIALSQASLDDFLQTASVSGFDRILMPKGRWPKLSHRETEIEVDILPEGGRPGTASRPAPTTIPHPESMGAVRGALRYIRLIPLIELKMAAGRLRDEADVIELIRENPGSVDEMRQHLLAIHPRYAARFEELLKHVDDSASGPA
jgi:hypothetical protein